MVDRSGPSARVTSGGWPNGWRSRAAASAASRCSRRGSAITSAIPGSTAAGPRGDLMELEAGRPQRCCAVAAADDCPPRQVGLQDRRAVLFPRSLMPSPRQSPASPPGERVIDGTGAGIPSSPASCWPAGQEAADGGPGEAATSPRRAEPDRRPPGRVISPDRRMTLPGARPAETARARSRSRSCAG
jgi:hypothetical protein